MTASSTPAELPAGRERTRDIAMMHQMRVAVDDANWITKMTTTWAVGVIREVCEFPQESAVARQLSPRAAMRPGLSEMSAMLAVSPEQAKRRGRCIICGTVIDWAQVSGTEH